MTERYGGDESAQDRARQRLRELEEQRRGESSGFGEESSGFREESSGLREESSGFRETSEQGEASERASEYAEQGQEKAAEVAEQGREKAKGQISTQKERASGELQGIARALQSTGEQLREQDQDSIGQYADQAAETGGAIL